jgi:hypothetical protein
MTENEIEIPQRYVDIKHPILTKSCPVCTKQFAVGDKILLVPLQQSKLDVSIPITSICLPVHT